MSGDESFRRVGPVLCEVNENLWERGFYRGYISSEDQLVVLGCTALVDGVCLLAGRKCPMKQVKDEESLDSSSNG